MPPSIWDAFKQYLGDAAPGGALNPEVSRQGLLDSAAIATTPVPLLGDAVGLLADANRYATDPSSRTPGNFALSGLGLLPFVPSMAGMVKVGTDWTQKAAPKVEHLAKTQKRYLFHSATADKLNDIHYGLEPQQGGPWVREVASGAVDGNVDDFLSTTTPLAWLSDKPSWVQMQVARKLNKPLSQVSEADIAEHGHLAMFRKNSDEAKRGAVHRVGDSGLMDGPYSTVVDVRGKKKKAYETDIYQDGLEPFGVERNEWLATQALDPAVQLTGSDLVKYLRAAGLLK